MAEQKDWKELVKNLIRFVEEADQEHERQVEEEKDAELKMDVDKKE